MAEYILKQEIIVNLWLLTHIFLCSRFIWGERSKGEWFYTKYFAYARSVSGVNSSFICLSIQWFLAFGINVVYIMSFFLTTIPNIFYTTLGVLTLFLSLLCTWLHLHYRPGSPYSQDERASKLLKRNRDIFFIQLIITFVLIVASMLSVYFATAKNSSITFLLGAIWGIILWCSVYLYYSLKLKRELIYLSFKLILQNKIRTFEEWRLWLNFSKHTMVKMEKKISSLLALYGFEDRIFYQEAVFKIA